MKKIFCIMLLLALVLTGCQWTESAESEEVDKILKVIYHNGIGTICVDTRTGVQYFSRYNAGSCVMVDATGNPLIYEGENND